MYEGKKVVKWHELNANVVTSLYHRERKRVRY